MENMEPCAIIAQVEIWTNRQQPGDPGRGVCRMSDWSKAMDLVDAGYLLCEFHGCDEYRGPEFFLSEPRKG